MPKLAFSENEKRYLADAPKVSWTAVASGAWGEDAETYMADHIPGRSFFVGLNAYTELWTETTLFLRFHMSFAHR